MTVQLNAAKQTLRRLLPAPIRRRLRATHRDLTFRITMADFRRRPDEYRNPDNPKLAKLIYGWGNAGWSGWEDFLAGCVDEALNLEDGAVVECGTGLSTLLVGSIVTSRQVPHIALEHHAEWADNIQTWCDRYGLSTQVLHAPLMDGPDYDWYDTTNIALLATATLVLCDGPPGDTKGGRSGVMDKLAPMVTSGTRVLMDDVDRPAELELTRVWADRLGSDYEVVGRKKPFARIVVR